MRFPTYECRSHFKVFSERFASTCTVCCKILASETFAQRGAISEGGRRIAMILFGLYSLSGRGIPGLKITPKSPVTYFGSFTFGCILGMSWTPCVGPILVGILLLAATTVSLPTGSLLLVSYATGLAIPLILVSAYLGRVDRNSLAWRIIRGKDIKLVLGDKQFTLHTNTLFSGILFIVLGCLVFAGILYSLNQLVATTSIQQWFFEIENNLLQVLHN